MISTTSWIKRGLPVHIFMDLQDAITLEAPGRANLMSQPDSRRGIDYVVHCKLFELGRDMVVDLRIDDVESYPKIILGNIHLLSLQFLNYLERTYIICGMILEFA
jgi:hypothetical protein